MSDNGNGLKISAIRPGILVGLHVTHEGGREYDTKRREVATSGTREVTDIQTRRTVYDREEWDRAAKLQRDARYAVERICIRTDFGPLCPLAREAELTDAVIEARRLVAEFNQTARYSYLRVMVLPARVASTDAEAAYSITAEVRALIDSMREGIDRAGLPGKAEEAVEQIREAASRAARLGQMLTEENGQKVNAAIDAARKIARDVVRRVQKGGEVTETVLADLKSETSAIDTSRIAFLDLETALAPTGEALPSVNVQRFAEVEVEAAADLSQPDAATVAYLDKIAPEPEAPAAPVPAIEIPDATEPEPPKAATPASDARDLDLFDL